MLEYLRPWVDLYKVDLKSFDDRHYHQLGGRLQTILDTIRHLYEMGFWLEIVTLVIPGFNDSDDELKRLTEFIASVSPEIPWHGTAFHKDYKMTDPDNTSAQTLMRAAEIGKKAGLRYVYAGNLPGEVGDWSFGHNISFTPPPSEYYRKTEGPPGAQKRQKGLNGKGSNATGANTRRVKNPLPKETNTVGPKGENGDGRKKGEPKKRK